MIKILLLISVLLSAVACRQKIPSNNEHVRIDLTHVQPFAADSMINVLIEIPAGTIQKWEYDKERNLMVMDSIDGKPRKIDYLGYPANYGMIPNTLSRKSEGGDGDALDVIVLGDVLRSGEMVECKLLGVLLLKDRGETDDKLIAVEAGSPMAGVSDLKDLDNNYPGLSDMLELWFVNYKGVNHKGVRLMSSCGFGEREEAMKILDEAI